MRADTPSRSLTRGWPGFPYLVAIAAAASVVVLIALISAELYPAAIIFVLIWATAAAVTVIGSMEEAAKNRLAAVILVVWFITAPVAWFFIRFPVEKSIVTYERLVFALVGLIALSRLLGSKNTERLSHSGKTDLRGANGEAARKDLGALSNRLLRFEAVWILLTLLACLSALTVSGATGYAFKTAVDAFALPLVAFYGARTYLQSPGHRRFLVVAAALLGLLLLSTGAFEFFSGINLLPYQGSEIIREGEPRVNGPFITDTSFAIVSLMLALFLRMAPRVFKLEFDAGGRLLYTLGIGTAILACLLPLFRAVGIALAVCWAAEGVLNSQTRSDHAIADGYSGFAPAGGESKQPAAHQYSRLRPILRVALVSIFLTAAVLVAAPHSIRDRLVSPRNAYGRLLSWRLAANMIYGHPILGVGLANYVDYFGREYSGGRTALEQELDTRIVRYPHSNLVWITAELGLAGLALYVAANILLLVPACRAVRRNRKGRARAAGICVIVLLAGYWIPGLELTSGMYSELNLYFFFLLGLIFPLLQPEGQTNAQALA